MADDEQGVQQRWDGPFDTEAYKIARSILEQDKQRVLSEVKGEARRRGRIVIIAAVVWAVCSVVLAFVNPDLLLVAEIGWVAVVAWAVFWLLPTLMGQANLDDLYDQYEEQLVKLEEARIAMPTPSCIEDLVAAIDLVSPSE